MLRNIGACANNIQKLLIDLNFGRIVPKRYLITEKDAFWVDNWINNSKIDNLQTIANTGRNWLRALIKALMEFSPQAQQY